jgi:propionyl-CoA carboxylase beta chain
MNSKSMSADIVYAWPIAEIAVMGAAGAVKVLYKKQIAAAADPQREAERLEQSYEESFLNTDTAENKGFIDEVILPEETRSRLITGFSFLAGKDRGIPGRKHGNIPL